MTQPPDEQPTVAWTPPEEPPTDAEPSATPVDAAPAEPTAAPGPEGPIDAAPVTPIDAPPAVDAASAPGAPSDSTPDAQNPLISWAPSGAAAAGAAGAAGASDAAGAAGAAGAAAETPGAVVGWEPPSTALPPSAVEGYATAGVGARIVAWLLDGSILLILSIAVLTVFLIVGGDTFARDTFATSALTAILTTGFSFLYFVGQWTGGSGATLGMRSMGLRIVDAPGPAGLGIGPAVMRWVAFGYPLTILTLIPALGSVAGWALTGWSIILLITTAISDTNQGLHDRFAGSAVLRRVGAGSGWAVIGCLLIVGLLFLLAIILPLVFLANAGPEFWEEFQRQMEQQMELQS